MVSTAPAQSVFDSGAVHQSVREMRQQFTSSRRQLCRSPLPAAVPVLPLAKLDGAPALPVQTQSKLCGCVSVAVTSAALHEKPLSVPVDSAQSATDGMVVVVVVVV